jgi:hypothetical protein
MTPNYNLSEIDHLFFDIFGFYPTKEGQSYEKIVGAALKIIYSDKKIIWDERKRGEYDKNIYQIDVGLYSIDNESVMVESKDHTKFKSKVSRPELDKVAGSLIELDFDSGLFFSATDYTRDAKKKSEGSKRNPNSKEISLYHLRPSTDVDRKGRIEVFKINIVTYEIDGENTTFNPSIPEKAFEHFTNLGIPAGIKSKTMFYYDETSIHCKGELFNETNIYIGEYEFLKTLDKSIFKSAEENDFIVSGVWDVDFGNVKIKDLNTNIDKVAFNIKFKEIINEFEVKSKGNPVLLIASDDGDINKLLTDHQLKGITFSEDGEISFDGREP